MSAVDLQSVISGSQESRVEALRQLLEYPTKQRDPEGSRFWFLRPGINEDEAEDTCPIAVGFCSKLDHLSTEVIPKSKAVFICIAIGIKSVSLTQHIIAHIALRWFSFYI